MRTWFHHNVPVRLKAGTTTIVNSAEQAARLLLEEWPVQSGKAYSAAKRAVLAALETGDPEGAELAFRAAAQEARILA